MTIWHYIISWNKYFIYYLKKYIVFEFLKYHLYGNPEPTLEMKRHLFFSALFLPLTIYILFGSSSPFLKCPILNFYLYSKLIFFYNINISLDWRRVGFLDRNIKKCNYYYLLKVNLRSTSAHVLRFLIAKLWKEIKPT